MIDNNEILKISPNIIFNEPMSKHTSFKIGGNADVFVNVCNIEEIKKLVSYCKNKDIPYMIMGNGTNMLVGDGGIRGVVIQINSKMQRCKIEGNTVYAEAGILLSKLSNLILRANLTGFEALSGIPGTLGGGIYMNAGAYGSEIKDVIREITYLNSAGDIITLKNKDIHFSYRHSHFENEECVILSAVLDLEKGDKEKIKSLMDDYNKRRSDKQPLNMPSAGSTFKRPEGYFAGKLIEDCGLMGYSIGGAQISDKHAGFIVNKGGALAKDVLNLIEYTQKTVMDKFNVKLEPEIRLIGEK